MGTDSQGVPIEPSAESRQMAHAVREVYLALLSEGFTQQEALTIIGKMLIAAVGGAGGSQGP